MHWEQMGELVYQGLVQVSVLKVFDWKKSFGDLVVFLNVSRGRLKNINKTY